MISGQSKEMGTRTEKKPSFFGWSPIQADRRGVLSQLGHQNHSLRYATHQLMQKMGMVAPSAHQIGNAKSAISPRTMKVVQKIFRCIGLSSGGSCLSIAPLTPPPVGAAFAYGLNSSVAESLLD